MFPGSRLRNDLSYEMLSGERKKDTWRKREKMQCMATLPSINPFDCTFKGTPLSHSREGTLLYFILCASAYTSTPLHAPILMSKLCPHFHCKVQILKFWNDSYSNMSFICIYANNIVATVFTICSLPTFTDFTPYIQQFFKEIQICVRGLHQKYEKN